VTITTTRPKAPARHTPAPRGWRRVAASPAAPPALGLAAAVLATVVLLLGGVTPLLAIAPLAAAAAVAGAVLAATRFTLFVLLLLVVRSGVDSVSGVEFASFNVVLSVAFLVIGLLWVAADIRGGGARTRTWAPSVALLAACLLSLTASENPTVGLVEFLRIASGLLMLEVLQRLVRDTKRLRQLLTAMMLSLVVPVGVGLYQALTGSGALNIATFDRVIGTFKHPNPFAIYLVLLLLAAIAMFPHLRTPGRVLLGVVAVPALVCLLFTYTRTGWIGLVVGALVIGILQSRRLIAAVVALVVVVLLLDPSASARLSDLSATETVSGATPNSLVWRVEYWQQTVHLAEGRPMTGLGLDMVRNTAQAELQPHNDFVRVGAELGVFGLAAYIWLLCALIGTARRALGATRGLRRDVRRGGAVAAAAAVSALLLMSVTSNVLSQVALLWYTAAVIGLAGPAALVLSRNGDQR
jgi:putative inorganic carbon (hco3(-)) transporter